jgi:hypothetical protein
MGRDSAQNISDSVVVVMQSTARLSSRREGAEPSAHHDRINQAALDPPAYAYADLHLFILSSLSYLESFIAFGPVF